MPRRPPFSEGRPLVAAAVEFAVDHHAGERRDADNAPFILHPLEVASLLSGRGLDDEVVAAGVLHDVLEQTEATVPELRERFGDRVAGLVAAVSEDDAISAYGPRKAALREQVAAAGEEAQSVYLADKIAKARELRAHAAKDPAVLDDPSVRRRLGHYEESLAMLREAAPELPMIDQLAFELWALRRLPPTG